MKEAPAFAVALTKRLPLDVAAVLESFGFAIESSRYRNIGGETFLWMIIAKPE